MKREYPLQNIELEYQDKLPILIINPIHKYLPDKKQLHYILNKYQKSGTENLVLDLSNCFEIDSEFFVSINNFADNLGDNGSIIGIVIPSRLVLKGLKIKLINEMIEIYDSRYDAVYHMLS
jgi:hypothetical protein